MTKILNFVLKIKGGGREGGKCEVLRPCHPPKIWNVHKIDPELLHLLLWSIRSRYYKKYLDQINVHCFCFCAHHFLRICVHRFPFGAHRFGNLVYTLLVNQKLHSFIQISVHNVLVYKTFCKAIKVADY